MPGLHDETQGTAWGLGVCSASFITIIKPESLMFSNTHICTQICCSSRGRQCAQNVQKLGFDKIKGQTIYYLSSTRVWP